MTRCGNFDTCLDFFQEQAKTLPATAHFFEEIYCNASNEHCARLLVFTARGAENVPIDLFPCQQVRGQLLAKGRQKLT